MSGKALQLLDISGSHDVEDLRKILKHNFAALQLIIDGLTGERLEDWTPVLRDGSVSMTGDLALLGGSLQIKSADGTEETAWRRGGDGTLEHRDEVSAAYTPVYDPEYKDVTGERSLNTVYKNKNKYRTCQITIKLYST